MISKDQLYADVMHIPNPATSEMRHNPAKERKTYNDNEAFMLRVWKGVHKGFIPTENKDVNAAIERLSPVIYYGRDWDLMTPHYDPDGGAIVFPYPEAFISPEAYARTVMHELSHWTQDNGSPRDFRLPMVTDSLRGFIIPMACEELTAELSVYFLMKRWNITDQWTTDYNMEYLRAWLDNIRDRGHPEDQVEEVFSIAFRNSQRAADLISPLV